MLAFHTLCFTSVLNCEILFMPNSHNSSHFMWNHPTFCYLFIQNHEKIVKMTNHRFHCSRKWWNLKSRTSLINVNFDHDRSLFSTICVHFVTRPQCKNQEHHQPTSLFWLLWGLLPDNNHFCSSVPLIQIWSEQEEHRDEGGFTDLCWLSIILSFSYNVHCILARKYRGSQGGC